jgi:hypothetical protein
VPELSIYRVMLTWYPSCKTTLNAFGMMMSLNMLIEAGTGFDYTFADFNKWATIVGFKSTALLPLTGRSSAAIAYK